MENYLVELDPKYKVPLCKLRLSNHKLPVVTGSFSQIPYEDRLCSLCDQGSIRNEWHYVFDCPYFLDLRKQYLKPQYHDTGWQNVEQNKCLFNSKDIYELENLATFVKEIMNNFQDK